MKCATHLCRHKVRKGHLRCSRCESQRWRKQHPVHAAYLALKANAKRRGKFFDLTLDQFEAFAVRTGYMKKKGIYQESWHIDRINEDGGYTIDNIQVLTNRQNVRKYLKYSYNEHGKPVHFHTVVYKRQLQPVGVPF